MIPQPKWQVSGTTTTAISSSYHDGWHVIVTDLRGQFPMDATNNIAFEGFNTSFHVSVFRGVGYVHGTQGKSMYLMDTNGDISTGYVAFVLGLTQAEADILTPRIAQLTGLNPVP